jgi:hypothetical protein
VPSPHLRVVRDVELDQAASESQVAGTPEKLGNQGYDVVAILRRVIRQGVDENVVHRGLEDRLRIFDRSAPLPLLADAGVTRGGERALAEIRADPERVLIHPAHELLGLWEEEASVDEGFGDGVELPLDGGVRTAP